MMNEFNHDGYKEALRRINAAKQGNATSLNLVGLGLASVPPEVFALIGLNRLELSNNRLTTLPSEIASLNSLQKVYATNNLLSTVPTEFSALKHLTGIYLSNNRLSKVPPAIFSLVALQSLDLGNNHISQLPNEISLLPSLASLLLNENKLDHLPPEITELKNLAFLALGGNAFEVMPKELWELKELTDLFFWGHSIQQVPMEIGSLTKLGLLNLRENQLTSLPPEIGLLTQLERLYLSGNKLSALPKECRDLVKLKELELDNNQLTTLPHEIRSLKKLQSIILDNNPFPDEVIRLAKTNVRDALAYLDELSYTGRPIREAKLVIVGEGGVGKTCLLRALKNEPFKKQKSTAGVEVAVEALSLNRGSTKSRVSFSLNAWDFAGQDIYRVTHQFFFTRRAIYLVLWNVRAGPTQGAVEFWLNTIRQRVGEHARVFVVATHVESEKTIEDIRRQELKGRFGEMIVDFVEVDSKTGFGIEKLKTAIVKSTASLEGINDPVPTKYLTARDRLMTIIKTEWCTFARFAEASGLDADEARRLAFLLSTWGRIVYFGDDGRDQDGAPQQGTLASYVVLKPEWLTKAIALILEDERTKKRMRFSSMTALCRFGRNIRSPIDRNMLAKIIRF